nr:Chain B, Cyclic AMP-dependent transcription factor ATF-2 [Homo sapiens]
KHEMTLKF